MGFVTGEIMRALQGIPSFKHLKEEDLRRHDPGKRVRKEWQKAREES
jgi:hypothetical protein